MTCTHADKDFQNAHRFIRPSRRRIAPVLALGGARFTMAASVVLPWVCDAVICTEDAERSPRFPFAWRA